MTSLSKYLQILLFLSITGILYPQSVYLENSKSNENADTLSYKLDSIIVKSSRYRQSLLNISQSVIILETSSLQNPGKGSSLDQALKYVPGLIVNDRNNSSQGDRISIRGVGSRAQFGVRGIKIYLDGIPLTTADGGSQLNNIDINSIGRIEIISGPNSVLYGNSAGGVVYLESKRPDFNNYFLEPELISGAYGYKKIKISGGIKFGIGDISPKRKYSE